MNVRGKPGVISSPPPLISPSVPFSVLQLFYILHEQEVSLLTLFSHSHNISLRRITKIMLLTIISGSWIMDKMKDIKGKGIQMLEEDMGEEVPNLKTVRRKDMDGAARRSFQRLPSAALAVAVLGLSSFASAVPILAKELDTPGAAAMATSTAGDIIPVKQVASDYSSQPLLKQVGDMLATSKASLQALATGGGTTESSQEMDIAVVKLDVIAKSPRYTNDGGVEEFQEMSAIMTLLKNQLSDPAFISSLPEHLRNSMQMLQQEMANAERAMEQIEPIIGSSQIDSSSSSRTSTDRSSANTNAVKREYEQSIASKRRVLNEGGTTTDQHEQDANQEDSTFRQGEGSSSSFPFQPQTDARKQEKFHELLNGQGQGRHARARMNWQGDQSRRRLNEDNGFCASVENAASQTKQKNAQCARLADCAKDYSLYDLFVYMHGDDIDFATGTVDKRIRGFDEINMRLKLHRIKDLSADLLGPTPVYDECDKLLQQFHRFDEGLGTFGGMYMARRVCDIRMSRAGHFKVFESAVYCSNHD